MYKAIDIVKYIIYLANLNGDLITNLKLQKLLYYAQAWYLVNFNGRPLFSDSIEAWQYGPVVPNIYYEFNNFGRKPVDLDVQESELSQFINEDREYIEEFCENFMSVSATELVGMTHNEKPWIDAYNNPSNNIIDNQAIYDYYSKL